MPFAPRRPYNDLSLPPPASDLETVPVLKACITAGAALAELKAVGGLIPDQAVLINSIPLLEAQAGSEIENILFVQPYCRISNLVEAGIAQRQSAPVYLKALARLGVLNEVKIGRERLFTNPALLRLLTGDRGIRSNRSRRAGAHSL